VGIQVEGNVGGNLIFLSKRVARKRNGGEFICWVFWCVGFSASEGEVGDETWIYGLSSFFTGKEEWEPYQFLLEKLLTTTEKRAGKKK